MSDYISREAAIKDLLLLAKRRAERNAHLAADEEEIIRWIRTLPAADVRPVVHGEWEHKVTSSYAGGGATFCSVCGYGYSDGAFFEVEDFDYCPHCGATMKVDRRDIELL